MPNFTAYAQSGTYVASEQGVDATSPLPVHADPARYWLQLGAEASEEMYITWEEPTSAYDAGGIEFRVRGTSDAWVFEAATRLTNPEDAGRYIFRVSLTGLTPNTEYEWRFTQSGSVRWFRTLPSTLGVGDTVVACAGADLYHNEATRHDDNRPALRSVTDNMAAADPEFVIGVGDWAYADGSGSKLWKWDDLWDILVPRFELADGRVVPHVPAIGNHEVMGGYSSSKADAPIFYAYFVVPSAHAGAYHEVQAGDWLSIVAIDSEHTSGPMTGNTAQEQWLSSVLTANAAQTHRIVCQHVPFYPGDRDFNGVQQARLRTYLAPVFENAGIRLVLDGHDHVYCRTHYMKAGVVDVTGVRYLGDGIWGVNPREGFNAAEAYVDQVHGTLNGVEANAQGHNVLTFRQTDMVVDSVNEAGTTFYTYTEDYNAADAPSVPQNVAASAGAREVTATWTAPADEGGASVDNYDARLVRDSDDVVIDTQTALLGSPATWTEADGVVAGVAYYVEVRADNGLGVSAWEPNTGPAVTPTAEVPGAVTGETISAGDATVTVSWTAPSDDGGSAITGYEVELKRSSDDVTVSTKTPVSTSQQFVGADGVTNGVAYYARIRAVNAIGNSSWVTTQNVTPDAPSSTLPSAPQNVTATAGDETVIGGWDNPTDLGGGNLESFDVELLRDSDSAVIAQAYDIQTYTRAFYGADGVFNGTAYRVRARANNPAGPGPWAESTAVTPASGAVVPGAPQNVVATPLSTPGSVRVEWEPPAADGGAPITRYRITITEVP